MRARKRRSSREWILRAESGEEEGNEKSSCWPVTSIARCFTLRASGGDRPGLTRRQSRSRLRGSYEEVGRGSRSLLTALSLPPGTLRLHDDHPHSGAMTAVRLFPLAPPATAGRDWRPATANGRRAVPLVLRTVSRRLARAPSRRSGRATGRVGCRASGGNLHSTLPTAAVGSVARRPRNATVLRYEAACNSHRNCRTNDEGADRNSPPRETRGLLSVRARAVPPKSRVRSSSWLCPYREDTRRWQSSPRPSPRPGVRSAARSQKQSTTSDTSEAGSANDRGFSPVTT